MDVRILALIQVGMGKQTAESARLFTFLRRVSELGIAERHVSGSGRRVPSGVEIISVVIMDGNRPGMSDRGIS